MSPMVFKTQEGTHLPVDLLGVGQLPAGGRGGIPVAQAAEAMAELQERDDRGVLVLDDDGNPKPLSGGKLTAAANAFAEARGLQVANVPEAKLADLALESGQPPDRPPAQEVAEAAARWEAALEPVNTDPEELVRGDATDGVLYEPPQAEREELVPVPPIAPENTGTDRGVEVGDEPAPAPATETTGPEGGGR